MYDIIIFDGLDRLGKSTTKKYLEKLTNYKYICVDRMYPSAICYEKIKNRNNNIEYYRQQFEKLCKNFKILIIYLYIDNKDILKKRIIDEKEEVLKFDEVDNLSKIYDEELEYLHQYINFDLCKKSVDNFIYYKDLQILAAQIIKEYNL